MGETLSKISSVLRLASEISEKDIQDYTKLTYLKRNDILNAYKMFKKLPSDDRFSDEISSMLTEDVKNALSELRVGLFSDRIMRVFCGRKRRMSFEEFLSMLSIFSDACPQHVKTEYAFRIYDFDEDNYLSADDLRGLLNRQSGDKLNHEEIRVIIENIFEEMDEKRTGYMSIFDFKKMISHCIRFSSSFRFLSVR
nr:calcium and integrin-binding protein 1-like [Parasteatoda tepidariorum]